MSATVAETMIATMAADLAGARLAVQGIATPLVTTALLLARRTCAPDLRFGYAIGNSFGAGLGVNSLTDPEALTLSAGVGRFGFAEAAAEFLPWENPLEFFRPAQVDPTGATNNVVIGPWLAPKLRLPGAAGIPDVSVTTRTARLYVPKHDPRVFVETLDFVSGAGFAAGVRPGPLKVFTNLATLVLRDGRLGVEGLMPGVELAEVAARTGFGLAPGPPPRALAPPDAATLALIRELDPHGLREVDFLPTRERFLKLLAICRAEERARGAAGAVPLPPDRG